MPSDRKKKVAAAKASKAAAGKSAAAAGSDEDSSQPGVAESMASLTQEMASSSIQDTGRTCAGVLASHPQSRDVHIASFTLLYHGHMLLEDAQLELNYGR